MTRIICAPEGFDFEAHQPVDLQVVLYGRTNDGVRGSIGAAVREVIHQQRLIPTPRAWDLLSIALSVIAADTCVYREDSPDGWTRQIDLHISVSDPAFWTTQRDLITQQLRFLTNDIWNITFLDGGLQFLPVRLPLIPDQDCIVLLSGGLDSLIGTIDLVAQGRTPYAVSQVYRGNGQKQRHFALTIGGGLRHLQLNHNAESPDDQYDELSQRARSIIFLAYGVLAASTLKMYNEGRPVTLYVCENGFISINPPLTDLRLGSLSTRTTHPVFIKMFQQLLDNAGLRVNIENPYQFATKGEMLARCSDQRFLREYAHTSTSCGRYARYGYTHCGRCLPCLIRRAAFHAWGVRDRTNYVYEDLLHQAFDDDVRSAAMAVATAREEGITNWAGTALSTVLLGDATPFKEVVERGLEELAAFLGAVGVL